MFRILTATAAAALVVASSSARAETDTLRVVQQFGHIFMPIHVAID